MRRLAAAMLARWQRSAHAYRLLRRRYIECPMQLWKEHAGACVCLPINTC